MGLLAKNRGHMCVAPTASARALRAVSTILSRPLAGIRLLQQTTSKVARTWPEARSVDFAGHSPGGRSHASQASDKLPRSGARRQIAAAGFDHALNSCVLISLNYHACDAGGPISALHIHVIGGENAILPLSCYVRVVISYQSLQSGGGGRHRHRPERRREKASRVAVPTR